MRFVTSGIGTALLAAALLLPAPAAAQVSFGVSGGVSLATLTGDDVEGDLNRRSGFNAGVFVALPLADIVWLVPGLYYLQKGADVDDGIVEEVSIDYLELPLLLRVGVSDRTPVGVDLFLGPTFAYQIGCEVSTNTISVDCDDATSSSLDLTKSFDVGFAVGAGLSFEISPSVDLFGQALWDFGLTSIDNSPQENSVKNDAILLNVGLAFRR